MISRRIRLGLALPPFMIIPDARAAEIPREEYLRLLPLDRPAPVRGPR